MQRKILILLMTMLLALSQVASVFAATIHGKTSGGTAIQNVSTVSDAYVNSLYSFNTSYDQSSTVVTGTGVAYTTHKTMPGIDIAYIIVTQGDSAKDVVVRYPKYLLYAGSYYDVVLKITGTYVESEKTAISVNKTVPMINIGRHPVFGADGSAITEITTKESRGTKEVGWTVSICQPGTNTVVNLPNLHIGALDIDAGTAYDNGTRSIESLTINGITASSANTYIRSNTVGNIMYNSGSFYGVISSDDNDNSAYIKTGSGAVSGYFAISAATNNAGNPTDPYGSVGFTFYSTKYTVTYTTDGHGTVGLSSEKKFQNENPSGSSQTPATGYAFKNWTVNKAVTLKDGTSIAAGGTLTDAQVKNVVVTQDLTFTANYWPPHKVEYKWSGANPGKTLPASKTGIVHGSSYAVDTTYKAGDTQYATNVSYNGTTYPRGMWKFNGWDKSGTITINADTVITGTWSFTPYWNLNYQWAGDHPNKAVPSAINDIPNGTVKAVDTTYKAGNTVYETNVTTGGRTYPRGTWTFNGWDKSGNITMTSDVTVKGSWSFTPEWNIKTSVVDGTITPTETNIPQGQSRTVTYTPKHGYGLKKIIVDGNEVSRTDYPTSYTFTNLSADHTVRAEFVAPKVETTKTSDATYYQKGEIVTYTLTLKNKTSEYGTFDENVVLEDTIPDYLQLVSYKVKGGETDVDGNKLIFKVDKLAGEEYTITIRAKVITDNAPVKVDNTVTARGDISPDPASATSTVYVVKPDIEITKTADKEKYHPGDTVHYTIKVRNKAENSHADNVVVTDSELSVGQSIKAGSVQADKGTVTESGNGFTVNVGTLNGGESAVITFDALFDKPSLASKNVTNKAQAECSQLETREASVITKLVCDVEYKWDGDHPDKAVPGYESDLDWGSAYTVDDTYKTGDKVKGLVDGQKGSWRFNGWDKTGTFELKDDTVITGTWTFIPEYDIVTSVENGTITPTEIDIPEGENRVVSYTPSEGYQLKTLTVDGEDKDIKEYPASYTFNDIRSDHNIKAVFELIPELEVIKRSDKEVYNAGDTVTYTIIIRQKVNGAEARDVLLRDTLPEGVTLDKDSFSDNVNVTEKEDHSYVISVPSLASELTYSYCGVTEKGIDHEELINTANAEGSNVPSAAEDSATVKSLTPKPEIVKTVSSENPIYGEEITYYISVKEPQEGITLRNAHVEDELPEGVIYDGSDIAVDGNESTASIEKGIFKADIAELSTEAVFSFKVKVTAVEGEVVNTATLTGDDAEPVKDSAAFTVKEPKPEIQKSVSKDEACIGDKVSYKITAGTDIPLIDASIEDKIPSGIEVDEKSIKCSDKEAEISFEGGVITAKVKTLENSLEISYDAKLTSEGEHVNKASLSAMNFPKGPALAEAKIKAVYPSPVIIKEASEDEVCVGERANYTIKVYAEKGTIYDAVLTDVVPDNLSLYTESVKCSDENAKVTAKDNEITVSIDSLTGDIVDITYTALAVKAGKAENTAALSGSNTEKEVTDSAVITAYDPVGIITKTVEPSSVCIGDLSTYTITAYAEKGTIQNAEITDELPEGLEIVPESLTCENAEAKIKDGVVTLEKDFLTNEKVAITYKAKALTEGEKNNIAILSGANLPEKAKAEALLNVTKPLPVIVKKASSEEVYAGETVDYTIEAYADKGVVYDAVIKDALPDSMELVKDSVKCDAAEINVSGSTIEARLKAPLSDKIVLSYSAKALESGNHTNTAILSGSNLDKEISSSAQVKCNKPELKITKQVSSDQAKVGEKVHYTVSANVSGARNPVIEDNLPSGLELVEDSVEISGAKDGVVAAGENSITASAGDEIFTGEITVSYDAIVKKDGKHKNIAVLSADNTDKIIKAKAVVKGIKEEIVKEKVVIKKIKKLKEVKVLSPKTSDEAMPLVFAGILLAGAAGLALIAYKRRKDM